MTSVAVLGGGMGGMVAADELARRGFDVTVYEKWDRWGGKARSFGRYGTGRDGRPDLPGEHGFRFFPGWYRHVPESMADTRTDGGTVYDHLVEASRVVIAQADGAPRLVLPSRFPQSRDEWRLVLKTFRNRRSFGLSSEEIRTFAMKMLDLMAMSPERRTRELIGVTWWDYIEAERMSRQYKKLLATGLTRSLVAMKAEQACTRTVGDILIQMLIYALIPGKSTDRVLDGPTSDVWIEWWRRRLVELNVTLVDQSRVTGIELQDDRITSASVRVGGEERRVEADYFVSAVPVEVMAQLVDEPIASAAPTLARVGELEVQWMNGIVFYLKRDVPITHGHCILADSPWALTAISQAQFWQEPPTAYGRGETHGILSIDISNWTADGDRVVHKQAQHCSALEIASESWAQIKAHFDELTDDDLIAPLDDPELRSWFLDPDINTVPSEANGTANGLRPLRGLASVNELLESSAHNARLGQNTDAEPLLINTVNSWALRPQAATGIGNLLLASDYVRTNTDLATMEGANEAGRRAVNHILDAEGSSAARCNVYELRELWLFAPFRALDRLLLKAGRGPVNWHWLWRLDLWLLKGLVHLASRVARLLRLA